MYVCIVFSSISFFACDSDLKVDGKKQASTALWSPLMCPTQYPIGIKDTINISSDRWTRKSVQNTSEYANTQDQQWSMLFNQNVSYVHYGFSPPFSIEPFWDYLRLEGSNATYFFDSGNPPPLSGVIPLLGTKTGIGSPDNSARLINFRFHADYSVRQSGFNIDEMWLFCTDRGSPSSDHYINTNKPYEGFLLGDGDVIYVRANQLPNRELSILLWPDDENDDFDLYASPTYSLPTLSNATWTSRQVSGRADLIIIPPTSNMRTIYIAIGSYSGRGKFRFYVNKHDPNLQQTIYVTTNFNPTQTHKTHIKNMMYKFAQAAYFGTDGRHFVKEFKVKWNGLNNGNYSPPIKPFLFWAHGDNGANKCIHSPNGYPCSTGSADHITFEPRSWCGCAPPNEFVLGCSCSTSSQTQNYIHQWAARIAIHETGHCFYGIVRDHYHPNQSDGHSSMLSQPPISANLIDFCDDINGGWNPVPPNGAHPTTDPSDWDCLNNKLSDDRIGSTTPDPFYKTADITHNQPFATHINITEY